MEKSDTAKTHATTDDLLRVIGKQAVRIAELEAELTLIRANHVCRPKGAGDEGPSPEKSSSDSINSPNISLQTYEQLSRKHAELLARHEQLEAHFAIRERKYREAKDVVKQWKAYVYRKFPPGSRSRSPSIPSKELQKLEEESTVQQQDDTTMGVPDMLEDMNNNAAISALPAYPQKEAGQNPADAQSVTTEPARNRRRSVHVTSSQTTESLDELEHTPRAAIEREATCDDSPTLVSARQLKRKASPSFQKTYTRRIKQEPTSPDEGIEFNSQNYSSPHIPPQTMHQHETSDLNDIGLHLGTPRKPRLDLRVERHASPKQATRPWPTTSRKRTSVERREQSHRELPVKEMTKAKGIGQDVQDTMASSDHGIMHARTPGSPSGTALQQRSVNLPAPRPIRRSLKASKQDREDGNGAIGGSHESGGDARSQRENIERSPEIQIKQEEPTDARLDALLADHTPPTRTLLASAARPSAVESRKRQTPTMESTPGRADERATPSDRRRTAPRAARGGSREAPPSSMPEATTPLRSRPLGALQLEDFKINPGYLGTDFAYKDDSMRGREQRRTQLHTCTRPECCGETFRKVIEIGGTSVSGKSDDEALAAYLGPGWAETARSYGPEARREAITEAHVFCFAREHGRHRHAFQRRTTPPGFWRTDMPTTQEEENDRVQARRVQRQKVEERWREARRDGGRWLFRDE